MKKGDIVLVPFPFTDLTNTKIRPAIILSSKQDDITICFVTSLIILKDEDDIFVEKSDLNGLKLDSIIKINKIATIDKDLIEGKIGVLENHHIDKINERLIKYFDLDINYH